MTRFARRCALLLAALPLAIACRLHNLESAALAARGGGVQGGNGGDQPNYIADSAWFQGADKTVKVCVEIADFDVAAAQVADAARAAGAVWAAYFAELGVNFGARTPSTKFEVTEACAGGEDLVIHAGTPTEAMRAERQNYVDPVAFAHRDAFDAVAGWGKGYIWVGTSTDLPRLDACFGPTIVEGIGIIVASCPPARATNGLWQIDGTLTGILVHELGHVLGIGHLPGTIMASDITQMLLKALISPHRFPGFFRVDQTAALLPWRRPGVVLKGYFGERPTTDPFDDELATGPQPVSKLNLAAFEAVVGRAPFGNAEATLRADGAAYVLTVKDDRGATTVAIKVQTTLFDAMPSVAITAAGQASATSTNVSAVIAQARGQVETGVATVAGGEVAAAVVARNMGVSPLLVTMVIKGQSYTVFSR